LKNEKRTLISILLIVTVVLAVYTHVVNIKPKENVKLEFSRDAWENSPEKRFLMIDDMLVKYDFIGMDVDEIIDLLGKEYIGFDRHSIGYQTFGGIMREDAINFKLDEERKVIGIFFTN